MRREAKLRRQSMILVLVTGFLSLALAIVVAGELAMSPILFTPAVAFVVWAALRRIPRLLARRAFVRLFRQMSTRDTAGAWLTLLDLRELYIGSPVGAEQVRFYEAALLSLEEKHAQAAALMASLDRRLLGDAWEPALENNLAWNYVQMGDAPRALSAARASIKASSDGKGKGNVATPGRDLRAYQLGTLGAALVISGEADEAVPLLEQALARGGPSGDQATRAFYLGEALRALGRYDLAASAYLRATKEGPATRYGKHAAERLAERKSYRG